MIMSSATEHRPVNCFQSEFDRDVDSTLLFTKDLDEGELEYMRDVLHLLDLNNTMMGAVIQGAKLPDVSGLSKLSLSRVMSMMKRNEDVVAEVAYRSRYRQMPSLNDDDAYNECRIDYSAFVEPVTNNLLNTIRVSRCADEGLAPAQCDLIYPPYPTKEMPSWGSKMIDAMAKFPEGLVEGKLHWVGGHDYCIELEIDHIYNNDSNNDDVTTRNFNGKYCRLDLTPNAFDNISLSLSLQFGVCVPDTCSKEHVARYISEDNLLLRSLMENVLNMKLTKVYCGQELDSSTDIPFQAALGILLGFLFFGIIASIYDGFFRKMVVARQIAKLSPDSDSSKLEVEGFRRGIGLFHRLELFVVGFSWYSNIRKIFSTKHKADHLPVLNGIRYFSFAWVILGNTYVFGPIYQESWVAANIVPTILTLPRKWEFQVVINYHLNTDSFLLISGVLITYWFLKRFEKNGNKFSIRFFVHYVLHRYWRLMPAMMLTLMFYTCFYRYLADGPLFPSDVADAGNCRVNWWVDPLMVHNIVRTEHLCLTWLFYVPMIFQLHVAFLVALVPLVIWPTAGYAILGAMFTAHIGATAALTMKFRATGEFGKLFTGYYLVPWCRAGPLIIGMVVGIILHKTKCRVKINLGLVLLGWLCALGTMAAVVFSTYDEYREGGGRWSFSAHAAYDTIARSAWAVGLGWMVFACSTGYGGVISRFLGWDLFLPLSRLVYPTFLTHAMMVFRFPYTSRTMVYIDEYHFLYIVLGNLIYTVLMGIFFGLLWHYPASIGVEKAVCCKTVIQWVKAGRCPEEYENIEMETVHEKTKTPSTVSPN